MNTFWSAITSNYIINVGVTSWFSAQLIKTVLTFLQYRELRAERLFGAGGMPSSHSALVCSMTVGMAKLVGFDSPLFGLTFAFAMVVMYDAMGVRRAAGEQAKVLNYILHNWEQFKPENFERDLKELIGHTPLQVAVGSVLGIVVGLVGSLIAFGP